MVSAEKAGLYQTADMHPNDVATLQPMGLAGQQEGQQHGHDLPEEYDHFGDPNSELPPSYEASQATHPDDASSISSHPHQDVHVHRTEIPPPQVPQPTGNIDQKASLRDTSPSSANNLLLQRALRWTNIPSPIPDARYSHRLDRPVAIPSLPSATTPIQFARFYAKVLGFHEVYPAEFMNFIDNLNALSRSSSSSIASLRDASNPQNPTEHISAKYIFECNYRFFGPRGLWVRVLPLKQLAARTEVSEGEKESLFRNVLRAYRAGLEISAAAGGAATSAVNCFEPFIEGLSYSVPEPGVEVGEIRALAEEMAALNVRQNTRSAETGASGPSVNTQAQAGPSNHGGPSSRGNGWNALGNMIGAWGGRQGKMWGDWGAQQGKSWGEWGNKQGEMWSGIGEKIAAGPRIFETAGHDGYGRNFGPGGRGGHGPGPGPGPGPHHGPPGHPHAHPHHGGRGGHFSRGGPNFGGRGSHHHDRPHQHPAQQFVPHASFSGPQPDHPTHHITLNEKSKHLEEADSDSFSDSSDYTSDSDSDFSDDDTLVNGGHVSKSQVQGDGNPHWALQALTDQRAAHKSSQEQPPQSSSSSFILPRRERRRDREPRESRDATRSARQEFRTDRKAARRDRKADRKDDRRERRSHRRGGRREEDPVKVAERQVRRAQRVQARAERHARRTERAVRRQVGLGGSNGQSSGGRGVGGSAEHVGSFRAGDWRDGEGVDDGREELLWLVVENVGSVDAAGVARYAGGFEGHQVTA